MSAYVCKPVPDTFLETIAQSGPYTMVIDLVNTRTEEPVFKCKVCAVGQWIAHACDQLPCEFVGVAPAAVGTASQVFKANIESVVAPTNPCPNIRFQIPAVAEIKVVVSIEEDSINIDIGVKAKGI